jgi:hypothetical protein
MKIALAAEHWPVAETEREFRRKISAFKCFSLVTSHARRTFGSSGAPFHCSPAAVVPAAIQSVNKINREQVSPLHPRHCYRG